MSEEDLPGRTSQSFRSDEIDACNQIFRVLRRGGDPRAVMKTEAFLSLERKFVTMYLRTNPRPPRASLHVGGNVREKSVFEILDEVFGDG